MGYDDKEPPGSVKTMSQSLSSISTLSNGCGDIDCDIIFSDPEVSPSLRYLQQTRMIRETLNV